MWLSHALRSNARKDRVTDRQKVTIKKYPLMNRSSSDRADTREGPGKLRQILDCGDGVCAIAAFTEEIDSAARERREHKKTEKKNRFESLRSPRVLTTDVRYVVCQREVF